MVRAGCVAIDVGANRGIYSHALSRIARCVEAFEPNPAIAGFARGKLGRRVRLHEVALSDHAGTAEFWLPRAADGVQLHLLDGLSDFHHTPAADHIEVRTATLDSFDFRDVGFIKIDVEGSELEVIAGGRQTIERERPNLVVELLTRPVDRALAAIECIEQEFGYQSWIMQDGHRPAREALKAPRATIPTNNVIFTPR